MALHFLFPAHPLRRGIPDPTFAEQMEAICKKGFSASLLYDPTIKGGAPLSGVPAESQVIYRGWMVKPEEYENIIGAIEKCSARPFTSKAEYLSTHYLPNWYPLLADLTPETRIYPPNVDIVSELNLLGWGSFFIKDYVKSLKAPPGAIVQKPEDAPAVLAAMLDYKGEIEGGVCVRRVEDFVSESERRYFILNGVPFGRKPIPDIVWEATSRLSRKFYSIDVVTRRDGKIRIVEVGDGQVSDLVGWSVDDFVEIWKSII
ncbi:MAG: ATP-grasp domain-containing protein [Planctomycetes bacterium]|nr:ATP-grasp domain-containing protein [Planctomycetota bacterium]